VADLQADAERLARLADDLLTLSREEAAAPAGEDVRLDELAYAAGADHVDAEAVTVVGDRAALERSVWNLVENARRHGRGAVSITVRVDGKHASLSVEDEGEGVHLLDRERVFERFYGDGSGLGLAIVRATAERHGGRAFVEGPRFTIELVRKASESMRQPEGEELEKGRP
jgi:signal transduction histidine kinase